MNCRVNLINNAFDKYAEKYVIRLFAFNKISLYDFLRSFLLKFIMRQFRVRAHLSLTDYISIGIMQPVQFNLLLFANN